MELQAVYLSAFWGVAAVIVLLLAQWAVATITKGSQKGAVPGKIDAELGHESFVFRSQRTFMNTLENVSALLGTAFLAVLIGANAFWVAVLIWVWVLARVMHMALYYAIATNQNPSPRSYFFVLGVLANIGLLGLCIATLL